VEQTEITWVKRKEVPVARLRKMMLEELQRRNLAQITVQGLPQARAVPRRLVAAVSALASMHTRSAG